MTGFLYPGQVIDKRITFASEVTVNPATATIRVNSVAYGASINGTHVPGSTTGDTWRFIATVPEIDDPTVVVGKYIVIEAYGNQNGVIQQIIIAEGTLVEITEDAGQDWTEEERAQIRYRLGLNGDASAPIPPVPDPIVIPPSLNPAMSVGYLITRNSEGIAVPNSKVKFQISRGPGIAGNSYTISSFLVESDEDALLVVELPRGAAYKAWVSDANKYTYFVVPDEDTFQIPEIFDL